MGPAYFSSGPDRVSNDYGQMQAKWRYMLISKKTNLGMWFYLEFYLAENHYHQTFNLNNVTV